MYPESFARTSVNVTMAPGTRPFSSCNVRTSSGIVIAGMTPGTFSCDTTTVLVVASTFNTMPRIGWRAGLPPEACARAGLPAEARATAGLPPEAWAKAGGWAPTIVDTAMSGTATRLTSAGSLPRTRPSEPEERTTEILRHVRELGDFENPVLPDIREALARAAGGPPDFHVDAADIRTEPDMLQQGRGAEGSAAADAPVHDAPPALAFHGDADTRADRGAVRLDADELDRDPVIAVAGVFEQAQRVRVARRGAADLEHDLLVAILIEVGKRDAVPLVQLAGPRRRRHVDKRPAALVAQQQTRHQRGVRRVSSSEIDIEKPVIVDVAEVGAHHHQDLVQPGLAGDVLKTAVAKIAIQLQRVSVSRQAQVGARHLVDRGDERSNEHILVSVVVVVEEPGRESLSRSGRAGGARQLGERPIAIVAVKEVRAAEVRDIQIRPAVVVVVDGGDALVEAATVDAGRRGDVLERAVAVVAEQLRRPVFVADEQIEKAIVVDIGPGRGLRAGQHLRQSARDRHVGKGAVAVVAQQRLALRHLPPAAQHQNVEMAVVVVVGLQDVQAAELIAQPCL